MSAKVNVTVDESKRNMTLEVVGSGLSRVIEFDLTDTKSIVEGVVAAFSAGDQFIEARLASLTKRVDSLETLSKDELQYLAQLLRLHPRASRADGRPTPDDELAKKLEGLAKN